eukprot:CAMPEP_0174878220 /NCGR_PEP_ID=MMETSP1114-20130205/82647_1 /TAXON_ID=312471 /ORGANISM="Neobodo designis, Strain CCAP 1951/1" /LENGTH=528 /DNA_ID=CAMNT_0016113607 /DNA_START=57 /DNA_END=1646 /DNA_ORIENTATION=-
MDSSPTTANACGPPTLEQTLHGVEPVTRPVANSRAAYDRMAPIYDLMTASSEHEFTDRGIAALNARPGERICEFGFGTGRAIEQFAKAVGPEGHVTGIDISPKMRDQALAKVRKAQVDGRVTLHKYSFCTLLAWVLLLLPRSSVQVRRMHASVTNPAATSAYRPPTLQHTTQTVAAVTRPVSESRAAYDRRASSYDLMTSSAENKAVDAGIAALDAQPGERICEFGFGTGRAIEQFAKAVGPEGHVTGIDISPKMRDQALAKVRKAQVDGRVTLHLGDVSDDQDSAATALQKEPQKFDAVVHVLLSGADGSARDSSRRATCSIVAGGRRAVGARGAGTSHRAAVRPDLRVGAPCVSERRRLSPDLPGGNGPRRVPVGDQSDAGHRVFDVGSALEIVTATKITATDGMPDAASLTSQGSPSDARGSFDAPSSATTSTFANGAGGDLVVDATTGLVRPLVSRSQWQTDDAAPFVSAKCIEATNTLSNSALSHGATTAECADRFGATNALSTAGWWWVTSVTALCVFAATA